MSKCLNDYNIRKSPHTKYELDNKGFASISMCQTSNMSGTSQFRTNISNTNLRVPAESKQTPRIVERFNNLEKNGININTQLHSNWMSIMIRVEGFTISKNNDEPYGSQQKVLWRNNKAFWNNSIFKEEQISISISVQFNRRLVTIVKYYPSKTDSNLITQHTTSKSLIFTMTTYRTI